MGNAWYPCIVPLNIYRNPTCWKSKIKGVTPKKPQNAPWKGPSAVVFFLLKVSASKKYGELIFIFTNAPQKQLLWNFEFEKKTSLKKKEKKLIWSPTPYPIGQQKRNPKPLDATFRKAGALMGNRLKPCGDPSLWAVFLCCGYTSRMYLELRRKNRLLFFGGQWGGVKNSHRIQFQFFLKLYELRIAKNAFFCNHQNYLITLNIFKFGLFSYWWAKPVPSVTQFVNWGWATWS